MKTRHISQLRRIGQLLRTLAKQEDADGDLDLAELLLHLSHQAHDVAIVAEDQQGPHALGGTIRIA
jgi:hypothetical protein